MDSRWTILKYATVFDPRRRRTAASNPFIINPGIRDLDPHQKTILSDDMGVACALGVIDQLFGIVGIADVYQWHKLGIIDLATQGRHRKMPDFVIETSRPLNNGNLFLLECKGSQTKNRHLRQLQTACDDQLSNVDTVHGIHSSAVPQVAIATYLPRGGEAKIYVSDPPTRIDDSSELRTRLKANYLALEYSFFRDFRSANKLWSEHGLPTWREGDAPTSAWEDTPALTWSDAGLSTLDAHPKFQSRRAVGVERSLDDSSCTASVEVDVQGSKTAHNVRQQEAWQDLTGIELRETEQLREESIDDSVHAGERFIREAGETFSGITIRGRFHIWRR